MSCGVEGQKANRKPPHPGKSKAQRRALDEIGCGCSTPFMAPKTRDALLDSGLIVPVGEKVVGRDAFGLVAITEYVMPISVHMQWCSAIACTDEEMAEIEPLSPPLSAL